MLPAFLVVTGVLYLTGIKFELSSGASAQGSAQQTKVNEPQLAQLRRALSFKSAGHSIRTEWFYSEGGASTPTVIILPGSGGIEDKGGFFRNMASSLSQAGITAVIVHYMDRSGLRAADGAQMGAHFGQWLQTVNDAVKFVQTQPRVDSKRVSILGHSLGAQLALHAVASDPSIVSVVDMAGCFVLPTAKIAHMPPVLILHGNADRVVPLNRERQMVAVLRRVGAHYEEHILKNADHAFGSVTEAELLSLITSFLKSEKFTKRN